MVFVFFNTMLMLFVIFICLYPMYYVLVSSISDPSTFARHTGPMFYPLGFSVEAYKKVFQNPLILSSYGNTIFYVVVGTFFNIFMSSLGAYVLSLQGLVLNKAFTKFAVFTMLFSGGLIPLFLVVKTLNLLDNRFALIIPSVISTYNMMIMRSYFMSIPPSLIESAKIDGANDISVLFKIVLPLSLPILATMVLYYGVSHWNSWFPALVYLRSRNLYPVQMILREILLLSNTSSMTMDVSLSDVVDVGHTIQYATIIVVTLPIVCVYPFLQRYFIKGLMVGAVKG